MASGDLDIDSMNIDNTINIEIGNNSGVLKQILNIIDEQKSKLSQLELLIKSLQKVVTFLLISRLPLSMGLPPFSFATI